MQLFENLQRAIVEHWNRNSFFINGVFYKYSELADTISKIRHSIQLNIIETEKIVGLIANDDIETYASILALWFEGKAYVPLSSETPVDRNKSIIDRAGLKTFLDSSENAFLKELKVIETKKLPENSINLLPKNTECNELVYMLFTSGTTGKPKGVPITRKNLTTFISAFEEMEFALTEEDRFLQMFELTFDLSVMSYLVPLLKGACVYTIPKDKIKYSYIYELMEEQALTVALMVPSMLNYLRPYFNEINVPHMKYSLFCGEALTLDIINEWSICVPNAKILNVYGPTENTIFCTQYTFSRTIENASHHGIISIGKAMKGTQIIIIDENNQILLPGNIGQLCLGGEQLTPGYWNSEEKNSEAFFFTDYSGSKERFYKTGDLCQYDSDGNLLYLGRMDFQTKIQGFRVELSEIEFFSRSYLNKINVIAIAVINSSGNTEICIILESEEFDTEGLVKNLKSKLPLYMVPTQFRFEKIFPLNINGKVDRNLLIKSGSKNGSEGGICSYYNPG